MSSPYSLSNFFGVPASFCGDIASVVFDDYFDVLVYIEIVYILLVWYGPKIMKDREPWNLKLFTGVWNLLLTLFAIGGFMGCGSLLMFLLRDRGVYASTCAFDKHYIYDGELSFWLFAFLLSKPPEMIDTVLLILQKKPLIFLHWFHHLTVTVFCWYAGRSLIPSGLWYATMNYGVHSVMYLYYFLCTLGLRRFIRPVAPYITGAQLAQMFAGTAMVLYTFYYSYISPRGCDVDKRTIRMGLAMYGTYVFLFAALFGRLYLNKGEKKKQVALATEAGVGAAVEHCNGESPYSPATANKRPPTAEAKANGSSANEDGSDKAFGKGSR